MVTRLALQLDYAEGLVERVPELRDLEAAGLDMVMVPEAYSFDAVSQLGYLAGTTGLQLASGVMQSFTRSPTLIAMTAAGLDHVSQGRFTLGLGASGPQVVEGFHGVPYRAPLGHLRETIEVCRAVWRREVLVHDGQHYTIPVREGTGLGKPLKLINRPPRERIPVMLAAIGPRSVATAAELAEAWLPIFFLPERAERVWGEPLAEGRARRQQGLPPLDVVAAAPLAIGDDVAGHLEHARRNLALYIGGMGARNRNFYNDLAVRYGFADEAAEVQDHYLAGRRDEAAAAVPEELVVGTSLIGTAADVRERVQALHQAGVTTIGVTLVQADPGARRHSVEVLRDLVDDVDRSMPAHAGERP